MTLNRRLMKIRDLIYTLFDTSFGQCVYTTHLYSRVRCLRDSVFLLSGWGVYKSGVRTFHKHVFQMQLWISIWRLGGHLSGQAVSEGYWLQCLFCMIWGVNFNNADFVLENTKSKILSDLETQNNRLSSANRPSEIVVDKEMETCHIVDVAVPVDKRAKLK